MANPFSAWLSRLPSSSFASPLPSSSDGPRLFDNVPALRVVTAESFRQGNVLELLAHAHVADLLSGSCADTDVEPEPVGTLCSGSEITACSLSSLQQACASNSFAPKLRFELQWMCEVDPVKRRWGLGVARALGHRDCCMFTNISDMCKPRAACEAHSSSSGCCVTKVKGAYCGTSCKDISKANPKGVAKSVFSKTNSPGGTADTFQGLLAFLDVGSPDWVITEQSDSLDDDDDSGCANKNRDVYLAEFGGRGYEIVGMLVEAADYGSVWWRRRSWFLALLSVGRRFHQVDFNRFFRDYEQLLIKLKRHPPNLADSLLPDSDPIVQNVISYKMEKAGMAENATKMSGDTLELHSKWFKSHNMRWSTVQLNPQTDASLWFRLKPERERDCIRFYQARDPNIVGIDTSQQIHRCRLLTAKHGAVLGPTCCANTSLFMFGDRCRDVTGFEKLIGAGFPADVLKVVVDSDPGSFHDEFLTNLAGNAFSGFVVLAMTSALYAAVLATTNTGNERASAASSTSGDAGTALRAIRALKRKRS